MNIYWVNVNNELPYEDYTEEYFIIAANCEKEAEKIGIDLFDKKWWNGYAVKSSAMLLIETHNGYKLKLL
jgi:hypothetical protein